MAEMIPDLEEYFRGFVRERDPLLRSLEEEAAREEIPIIGPVVGELLGLLVRATGARRILELGAATGYSAIYLARACEAVEGRVVTVENDAAMAERARRGIARAGLEGRVAVEEGDAAEVLSRLREPQDLIFLDIDKEHYLEALPHCVRLLRPGGLLVADNVGFELSAEFNRQAFAHPGLRSVHLLCFLPFHSPERDGLCLAVRTG